MAELPKDTIYHYERDGSNINITMTELVRCRDCRNWDTSWKPHSYEALYPRYYCAITDLVTSSDWFCADGERKERQ